MLWAGVDLFFILSGFLITGILIGAKERKLGDYFGHFYSRRARRILPPYALLLVITSILFGLAWARHWYLYFFLMNTIVPHGVSSPVSLTVLWSLGVEEQFYMLWPFAVYFLSEQAIGWVAGGLIVVAPMLRWLCTPTFQMHWNIYMLTPFRMDLLAMGALLAVVWRSHRDKIERYGVFGPLISMAAICVLFVLAQKPNFSTSANTRESNVFVYELTLIACTGIILWALGGRFVGVLRWPPICYLGRISYSIYLIHLTVLLVVNRYVGSHALVAAISAPLIVGYAALSWHFFEKPLLYGKTKNEVLPDVDEEAITEAGRVKVQSHF